MHLYRHHIGDYAAATSHLSFVEDAAYCRLLRIYYSNERMLPLEIKSIQRIVVARTKEEKEAVETILNEFFLLTDSGWSNKRADLEIADYQARAKKNREVGKLGGRPKKEITQMVTGNNPDGLNTETQMVTGNNPTVTVTVTNKEKESTKENSNAVAIATAKQPKAIRLPADWQLPKAMGEWAMEQGLTVNEVHAEADKFRDYWIAKSGKDATKNDWPATWRNWIRNRKTPSAEQKTFYEKTREAKERDADKRLMGLASCSIVELEALGLARDGVMLGARA